MRAMCITAVLLSLVPAGARAQACQEFCARPPCYRAPSDPDCDPACHCGAPDYPACDPHCKAGELCDPACDNPCFDAEFGDVCADPPPPCMPAEAGAAFEFVDDRDGDPNGEIFAVDDIDPRVSCGTLRVDTTGYYAIFDSELSESCADQRDETGYLTVHNSCNAGGWAAERNAGERFLVLDSDNTPPCETDDECGSGRVCREGNNHGRCCVPEDPVFMGTFLLVAGEDNEICLRHWCPEWEAEKSEGQDLGFVNANCEDINSIHFRVAQTAVACLDETMLHACSWGCEAGTCNPDPCDTADCGRYCKDGECLDENPCAGMGCVYGCVRGRCLQPPNAAGPDGDGDGFSQLADCDDGRADVHPKRPEVCGNGRDDNCNGFADEPPCEGDAVHDDADVDADAGGRAVDIRAGDRGPDVDAGTPQDKRAEGCGCAAGGGDVYAAWPVLVALVGVRRSGGRTRHRTARPRPGR